MAAETSTFAAESGHFYTADGTPAYEVPRADGKGMRGTTVRDARKLGLYPSATTILKVADKPGLTRWLQDQFAMEAYTRPPVPGESAEQWLAAVREGAGAQGKAAAERGTYIHGGIEAHFRGEPVPDDIWHIVAAAVECVHAACGPQEWAPERSFACDDGWGGKVDMSSPGWIIDYKTKASVGDSERTYDEHAMQLAAYRHGLGLHGARCGIVFVDRERAVARFAEIGAAELDDGLAMFRALHTFWCIKNRYWPAKLGRAAA